MVYVNNKQRFVNAVHKTLKNTSGRVTLSLTATLLRISFSRVKILIRDNNIVVSKIGLYTYITFEDLLTLNLRVGKRLPWALMHYLERYVREFNADPTSNVEQFYDNV